MMTVSWLEEMKKKKTLPTCYYRAFVHSFIFHPESERAFPKVEPLPATYHHDVADNRFSVEECGCFFVRCFCLHPQPLRSVTGVY